MTTYLMQTNGIKDLLVSFTETRKIDSRKSDQTIIAYIGFLTKKQFEVLNSPIPEDMQSVVFNALRNLIVIMKDMQNELKLAFERHENPTTAEKCLQIMPFISDLSNDLDQFVKLRNGKIIDSVYKNTRILRRKARNFSFLKSIEQEMEGINLTKKEIEDVINKYNSNLEAFLLIDK